MENKKEEVLLKLNTNVIYKEPITGEDRVIKLDECAGYLPVFNTIEEAELHSGDGKYEIMEITTSNPNS